MLSEELDRLAGGRAKESRVVTRSERWQAAGEWLLSAAPEATQGEAEWRNQGAAWLLPGILFSASSIPASIVHAAIGQQTPELCAEALAEALDGGPLFYSSDGFGPEGSYTALLPASVGRHGGVPGTVLHPQRALVKVPAPDCCERRLTGPWWVVPLDSPGVLCDADLLADVVMVGRRQLNQVIGGGNE